MLQLNEVFSGFMTHFFSVPYIWICTSRCNYLFKPNKNLCKSTEKKMYETLMSTFQGQNFNEMKMVQFPLLSLNKLLLS